MEKQRPKQIHIHHSQSFKVLNVVDEEINDRVDAKNNQIYNPKLSLSHQLHRYFHYYTSQLSKFLLIKTLTGPEKCYQNKNKNQPSTSLPLFFIDLNPVPNNPEIFKLTSLYYSKIKIEEPHSRRDLPRCYSCQNYRHTHTYCNGSSRSVRYGQNYPTDMCEKTKETPITCALSVRSGSMAYSFGSIQFNLCSNCYYLTCIFIYCSLLNPLFFLCNGNSSV